MATLGSYRTDTRRLLHDANSTYWTDANLNSYVNRAIKQRDRDSAMNRSIIPFNLVAGTAEYLISAVSASAIDVIGIILVWGNYRFQLRHEPYFTLGSVYQAYQGYQSTPVGFSKIGAARIRFGPIPNQVYVTEWDCVLQSVDLVNDGDADVLPDPWTDPVPFLAAHFAKIEIQQSEEAQQFMQLYAARMMEVISGARSIMVQNPYQLQPSIGWR